MIPTELETLQANPTWVKVLSAYRQAEAELPDDQTTVSRMNSFEEVPADKLSEIHGNLIALDLLKFELPDRQSGLFYQLTTLGKQSLNLLKKTPSTEHAPQTKAA